MSVYLFEGQRFPAGWGAISNHFCRKLPYLNDVPRLSVDLGEKGKRENDEDQNR
jgi:hypothetical protein